MAVSIGAPSQFGGGEEQVGIGFGIRDLISRHDGYEVRIDVE